MFLNELWELFKRNIFVVVLAVTLVVAAPWTLVFVLPAVIVVALLLFLKWKIYSAQQRMYDQANGQSASPHTSQSQQRRGGKVKSEGKVTVVRTEPAEQRINDDVGEYVDFKEVKSKNSK